jgi:exopolyphosphatase/guanosine-5'-triphosphate,3'-diphosphate pyrophosphatase
VVATSASASALLSAVHRITRAKRDQADRLRATTAQVRRVFKDITQKTLEERRKVTGIGPRRAEIIVPGVAVFLTILELLNLPAIHYCAAGLRDGLVADLAQRRVGRELARMTREQRAVVETLGRRFGADLRHARKLAEFGRGLFASLEPLHCLPPYYGKLLEAACYLYDIGHYISDISHHKHSQYIIANADLAGFTNSERQLIGQLCRYHRKAMPNQRHADFQSLGLDNRRALLLLIPLLRLVDGLDRSREQRVESVTCDLSGPDVLLRLRSNMDTDLEQWAVERVAEPFRQVYQRGLAVTVSKESR